MLEIPGVARRHRLVNLMSKETDGAASTYDSRRSPGFTR